MSLWRTAAPHERAVIRVIIATGVSSVVTQLLIIREFLAQFQGNEFVIALILFNWLILGGLGTMLAHLTGRRPDLTTIDLLAGLSLLLASLSSLMILAVRMLRDLFFIHGASVGFYPTLAYTFFSIAPYCLLLGFLLPFSLYVLRVEDPDYPGARAYMTDNLGDVIGGALFSFALVYLATPMLAVFLANLPLLAAVFLLFPVGRRHRPGILAVITLTLVVLVAGVFLETASLHTSEGKLVHYRESRYGRITVFRDREQFTLFSDGAPVSSSQNRSMAEEAIHYPLAQLSRARRILLISAEGGMLAEVARYHPDTVDYVELDPEIASAQFTFGLLKKIAHLNIINRDGRAFLAETRKTFDAIIVNLPEPETFQVNRFFTDRFFAMAKNRLAPRGILSFSMAGFDNYLGEPQRRKLSSLYNTVADHFEHVLLLPGQKVFFLCSSVPVRQDIPALLTAKGISTVYIDGYYHGNLTAERIARLNELVDPAVPKNSDVSPQLMRLMFSQWFAKFSTSPSGFIAGLLVLLLIYFVRLTKEEFVLFSTGCMTMGCEILVVFAFQIFFGYIYLQIGLIVTVFLAGLLPGAWFGEKWRKRGERLLTITDTLLIALLGLFILALHSIPQWLPVSFFLAFGFAVSLACGFQFPVALYLRGGGNPAIIRTFSADLIGAACGTLATSVLLIPYFGIIWAAAALIGLKMMSLLVTAAVHEKN